MVSLSEASRSHPVHDPVRGRVLDEVPWHTAADIEVIASRASEGGARWRALTADERSAALRRAAGMLEDNAEVLAEVETLNTGKPPVDTLREAHRAAGSFRYYAGWVQRMSGVTVDVGREAFLLTERRPRGTVLGIVPWNVPLFFAAKKLAPALAFGNACILKPAPETPLTAMRLVDLLHEAGVTVGAVQVAIGGGQLGQQLLEHPVVDAVVFTGSDATGREVAATAGRRGIPTVMELGGKSAQLVFADADIDAAVEGLLLGAFGATGQMCIAGSRIYAERSIADDLLERLCIRIERLRVGDPRSPGVHVGPQVTAAQRDKSFRMIEAARVQGAELLAQAPLPREPALEKGFFVAPTLLGAVDRGAEILTHEVFGPVALFDTFVGESDAVAKANLTPFGLAAGIWTRDLGRAHRVARAVQAGTVWINTYRVLSDLVPFGGNGWSGYGRENGEAALDVYTTHRAGWMPTGRCGPGTDL